jgi:TetR/AcrR family transcriptional regulator, biofilm operon repressor
MDKKDVRIPRQKRSIEKKEKIIEAATLIFMEQGYMNTNTADIAKAAGISTGSVYAYFEDKKDILLPCLYRFGEPLTQQISEKVGSLSFTENINHMIENVLGIFVNYHNWTKRLHDEIMSLQYIDDDIRNYFNNIQKTMMNAVTEQLRTAGYFLPHEREQTFLIFQMIMGIEDELAFNHSPDMNQKILIDECVKAIVPMLIKKDN